MTFDFHCGLYAEHINNGGNLEVYTFGNMLREAFERRVFTCCSILHGTVIIIVTEYNNAIIANVIPFKK
jgi:hypothetical protein